MKGAGDEATSPQRGAGVPDVAARRANRRWSLDESPAGPRSPQVGRAVPGLLTSRGRNAVISVGIARGVVVAHLASSTLAVSRAEFEKR